MNTPDGLVALWESIKGRGTERQARNNLVAAARRGDVETVLPGVFPPNWPKPVVANIIDVTARDIAEMLARLPAIDCESSQSTSGRSKKFSSRRTKIALYYIEHSRLKLQLYSGCDWLVTFAALPMIVEPDFEDRCPRIRLDDPRGAYWDLDFYGNVKCYAKSWTDTVASLCAKFPDMEDQIGPKVTTDAFGARVDHSDDKLTVVQMYHKNRITLFLPEKGDGLILSDTTHQLDRPPIVIAERPRWDQHNRGQFDDVMWVWLARARMAAYGLEATDKAVRAPLQIPDDVDQIPFGPDAVIRTNGDVKRVGLELPSSALVETQALDQEIADGARVPSARRGDVDASVITGRGVEALTSVFQTQLATLQDVLGDSLRRVIGMCFQMDETYWPEDRKTVTGMASGAPFTEDYVPARDIRGDYTCAVTYGMTAGMDPNRAIVFLLQARADQLIDRDTVQRQMPFEVDVEQLQRKVDIEQIQDALKQGLFGLLANAPTLSLQGMDPLQTLQRAAQIVTAREKGTPIHEAILDAFKPDENAPQAAPQSPLDQLAQAAGAADGAPPEQTPGDMSSVYGAGTAPDVAMLLASLTNSGQPNLQASVSRRLGTGI